MQVLTYAGFNCVLALGFYITYSTGQLSVAHGTFMGIGAYSASLFSIKTGMPFFFAILLGGLFAAGIGTLLAYPALRLRGLYLAIATLAICEGSVVILYNWDWAGGALGLPGIPLKTQPSHVFLLLALCTYFCWRLERSRMGRAFAAIKDDQDVAAAMGINVTYCRVISFAIGALFCGLAGGLYAHYLGVIEPKDFGFWTSTMIILYPVIGGTEVFWGSIFGATLLTLLPEVLREISKERMLIYGAIMVLIMVFRAQGIIDRDLVEVIFRFFRRSPPTNPRSDTSSN